MEISNTHFIHGAQSVQGPHRMAAAKESSSMSTQSRTIQDDVQFSEESLKVNAADQNEASSAGIRFELVNRIKAEIAAGTYETPDKMDIALDRLVAGMSLR